MLIPVKKQWKEVNNLADLANFAKELVKYTVTLGYYGFPKAKIEEKLHQNNTPLVNRKITVVPGSKKPFVAAISVGTLGFAIGFLGEYCLFGIRTLGIYFVGEATAIRVIGTALTNTPLIAGVGLGLALGVIAYKAWLEKRTTYEKVEAQGAEIVTNPEENPKDNLPLTKTIEETEEHLNETPLREEKDPSEDSSTESDDQPPAFPREIPPFDFSTVNQRKPPSEYGDNPPPEDKPSQDNGGNTPRKKALPKRPENNNNKPPSDLPPVLTIDKILEAHRKESPTNSTLENYSGAFEEQVKAISQKLIDLEYNLDDRDEEKWMAFVLQLINEKIKAKAAKKTLETEKEKIDKELYDALENLVNAVAKDAKGHKQHGAFAKRLKIFGV